MSEALEQTQGDGGGTQVTMEDLRRMLDDVTSERDAAVRDRDSERNERLRTQQERDSERTARIITERERDENAGRVVSEAEQRYNAEKQAVLSNIAAQKERVTMAEDAYARHAESGEWKSAAQAQRQLAEAAAQLTQLEARQQFLDTNKERFVPKPVERPAQPDHRQAISAPQDRITQLVGNSVLPAERSWIEQHPKFFDDENYRMQVFDASNLASRRYVRGSEQYIKEISRLMGDEPAAANDDRSGGRQQQTQPAPRQEPRQPSADIAPQRRPGPGAQPQGSAQEWKLSADEVEVADGMYGNPNDLAFDKGGSYIADPGERYKHYWDLKEKMRARGRL